MDNLFLIRDMMELALGVQDVDFGYLYGTLKAFGVGDLFISSVRWILFGESGTWTEKTSMGGEGDKAGLAIVWSAI